MSNGLVVLNYKNVVEVISFVKNVQEYAAVDHIVIVDNHSNDGSVENLKKLKNSKVTLLVSEKNNGYAAGNNIGCKFLVENLHCQNIFIANPDIVVSDKVMQNMIKFLEKNIDYAIVAPQMKNNDGQLSINYWELPTMIDDVVNTSVVMTYVLDKFNRNHFNPKITSSIQVDVVLGAFYAIKARFLTDIGFFDESTFLYNEENILGITTQKNGKKIGVLSNNFYVHFGGTSSKYTDIVMKYRYYFDGMIIYHKKYKKSSVMKLGLLRCFMCIGMVEKHLINLVRTKI